MVGCGMIAYELRPPFGAYLYHQVGQRWREFFRHYDKIRWIDSVEIRQDKVRFTVDANELDLNTSEAEPVRLNVDP